MKTGVSLPDALFAEAEQLAKRLGVSRSELYARAIARYVREQSGEALTTQIDRVLGRAPSKLDDALAQLQSRSLGADEGSYEDWVGSSRRGGRASEGRTKRRRG